jgi:hypothetical protein
MSYSSQRPRELVKPEYVNTAERTNRTERCWYFLMSSADIQNLQPFEVRLRAAGYCKTCLKAFKGIVIKRVLLALFNTFVKSKLR